jgi:hypothetical protein
MLLRPITETFTGGFDMSCSRLIAFAVAIALVPPSTALARDVKVQVNGYVNRTEYVRVESDGRHESIVLSRFGSADETRLLVTSRRSLESMPPVTELSAKQGSRSVVVAIRAGGQVTLDSGDGTARPVTLLPNPKVQVSYEGYYNRSSYARVESVDATSHVVLSSFGSQTETRLPVTSIRSLESLPPQTEIQAKGASRSVRIRIVQDDQTIARISVDGAPEVPFILIEN